VRCLDSSFVIDLVKGEAGAAAKARALDDAHEKPSIAAPALAEVLQGAYYKGGAILAKTLELLASLDVLEIDDQVAAEAGRLGAELLRRGASVPTVDLLIAAAAKLSQQILVTRDVAFQRIPDLAVETY
jgi:predicted nucleic acid-binding protein